MHVHLTGNEKKMKADQKHPIKLLCFAFNGRGSGAKGVVGTGSTGEDDNCSTDPSALSV